MRSVCGWWLPGAGRLLRVAFGFVCFVILVWNLAGYGRARLGVWVRNLPFGGQYLDGWGIAGSGGSPYGQSCVIAIWENCHGLHFLASSVGRR